MATKDRQEVGHAGKVTDIGKKIDRKFFLARTKGHVVIYLVCLVLVVFSTRHASQNN